MSNQEKIDQLTAGIQENNRIYSEGIKNVNDVVNSLTDGLQKLESEFIQLQSQPNAENLNFDAANAALSQVKQDAQDKLALIQADAKKAEDQLKKTDDAYVPTTDDTASSGDVVDPADDHHETSPAPGGDDTLTTGEGTDTTGQETLPGQEGTDTLGAGTGSDTPADGTGADNQATDPTLPAGAVGRNDQGQAIDANGNVIE